MIWVQIWDFRKVFIDIWQRFWQAFRATGDKFWCTHKLGAVYVVTITPKTLSACFCFCHGVLVATFHLLCFGSCVSVASFDPCVLVACMVACILVSQVTWSSIELFCKNSASNWNRFFMLTGVCQQNVILASALFFHCHGMHEGHMRSAFLQNRCQCLQSMSLFCWQKKLAIPSWNHLASRLRDVDFGWAHTMRPHCPLLKHQNTINDFVGQQDTSNLHPKCVVYFTKESCESKNMKVEADS